MNAVTEEVSSGSLQRKSPYDCITASRLDNRTCRAVVYTSEDQANEFGEALFCGNSVEGPNKPYCKAHAASYLRKSVYTAPPKKENIRRL